MIPIVRLIDSLRRLRSDYILRRYALNVDIENAVDALAEQQRSSPGDVAADLLGKALSQRKVDDNLWRNWLSLSPREQQVPALTCLNYTNPQIAARLGLSVETIRTHSRSAQIKFNIHSKSSLRVLLSEWDFSDWERHI